jgi:sialate O-acetylesterase
MAAKEINYSNSFTQTMKPSTFRVLSVLLLSQSATLAEVRLAPLFQEGMVLQRDMTVPVWGVARAGEEITVVFADQKKNTKADQDGHWRIELESLTGSAEGRQMTVTGENKIVLKDFVVGEVWICSGQSNMQMGVGRVPEIKALVPKAKQLRTFEVKRTGAFTERENCEGQWENGHPNSAVAFSFAHFLQQAAELPAGIILTCWGSSSLEAWMPRDMTKTVPHRNTFATPLRDIQR